MHSGGRRVSSQVPTVTYGCCPPAGGIGAARNLAALKSLAITHVVNASPIVPCFHAACLRYRTVAVFDDAGEDIARFFEATNQWISKVRWVLCTIRTAFCGVAHFSLVDDQKPKPRVTSIHMPTIGTVFCIVPSAVS